MPFVQTTDITLHYETAGEGQTTIVCIHGNFASWRWWRPMFEIVPDDYRVVALDLRGCGDSQQPSGGYTIPQMAKDVAAFLRALQLKNVHLVGHSLGGAVSLQTALDDPNLLRSLTLIAPAPADGLSFTNKRRLGSRYALLFGGSSRLSGDVLKAQYRLMRSLEANRPILRRALQRMAPTLRNDQLFAALVDDAARISPEAVIGFLETLEQWDVTELLSDLQLPTLILWGGLDRLIPLPAMQRMNAHLPRGELVIWPDVGHSPQLEQPGRVVDLLDKFIRQGTTPPDSRSTWATLMQRWLQHTGRSDR